MDGDRPTTIRRVHLPAPFAPVGDHLGIALPAGRALFTTRRGGVSEGPYASLNLGRWIDDDAEAVDRNRRILADTIGVPLDALLQGRQVHGNHVERRAVGDGALPEADGHATAEPGLAPMVITADCLPVALIGQHAVAMVHAGWRGLAAGVIEEGVNAILELGGDGEIQAAIGPGAGACCYEVGPEVHQAFGRPAASGRIDLKAIARERLSTAGVAAVHDVDLCTICNPELFFSHRRDDGVTGRQAGVAWRARDDRPTEGRQAGIAWRS